MLDPLLGEMEVETFISKALRRQVMLQIEELDNAIVRGHKVGPGGDMVLELNRIARRATLTLGGSEAVYYDCDAPSSAL